MEKDLELVRKVTSKNIINLSQLEGMDKVRGSTKIIQTLKNCNESLESVGDGCHSVLKLTRKATNTISTEKKLAATENRDELIETTKAAAKSARSALASPPTKNQLSIKIK